MISVEQIADLAPHYEEYNCAEDPSTPATKQARLLFLSGCKKVYADESEELRKKWTFEAYVGTFIVPELNRYLQRQQSKFTTIQPEKK